MYSVRLIARLLMLAAMASLGLFAGNARGKSPDLGKYVDCPAFSCTAEDAFHYDRSHRELRFQGRIGLDFDERLAAALDAHPRTQAVVVTSLGGFMESALRAASHLNDLGMPVRASGVCASSCAMLWSAAAHRELDADARLGLHASHAAQADLPAGIEALRAGNAQAQQSDILQRAGFSAALIGEAMDTPPNQVLWLDAGALRRAGVPYLLMD